MGSTHSTIDLLPFLQEALARFGINTSTPGPEYARFVATVDRDGAGFVLTAGKLASPAVQTFLDAHFGDPVFHSDATSIYRDDSCFTTVMLNREQDETKVIVLHWKDQAVKDEIAKAQEVGIDEAVRQELSALEQLLEEATAEGSKGESKLNEVLRRFEAMQSIIDPESECGENDVKR